MPLELHLMPLYCLNNISATLKFLAAGPSGRQLHAASRWAARPPTSRRHAAGPPAANFKPPAAGPPGRQLHAARPLDRLAANFTHLK
jgi:hypothetical protein